ncbi:MAG: DUF4290 domain-containing protein [Bacteroidaceae bacterium]|nr:DUF4290 domain-containing protein [Bacteroidaceae bacterium]
MDYNTTTKKLIMPEYGRMIQQMVDYTLTITDKQQRQAYAHKIIAIMGGLNPQMRNVPHFKEKLWNHLAAMADYQLDIDYPVEIVPNQKKKHPSPLCYPGNPIKYRHYGHLIEKVAEILKTMPEGPEQTDLLVHAANRMKQNLAEWQGDGVEIEKVIRDLEAYTQKDIPEAVVTLLQEKINTGKVPFEKNKRQQKNY